jgi:hypothetical protein
MSQRLGRRAFAWTAAWFAAAALYLLLIDSADLPELLVAAGAAVLAATGLELAREQGVVGESVRARWLLRVYRPFLRVPVDILILALVALHRQAEPRPAQARFRAVEFSCREQERLESGRRALAEALGSVAPNTFVIGIDVERELILAHQLRPTGGRETIDVLGLG